MTEESIIRDNSNFIRMCALRFIRERGLAPVSYYYEDVFQEACIAYLNWYRKSENGKPEWKKFAASAIRFHLLKRYINPFGFAVTGYAVDKRRPKPEIRVGLVDTPYMCILEERGHGFTEDDEDMAYKLDFDKWIESLNPQDREIVILLCKGYKPGEVMKKFGMERRDYSYRKNKIRKNYDKFFKEVG